MGERDAEDAEAIRDCLAGKPEAFVARFAGLIASVLREGGARGADLEELRQEVFLELFRDGGRRLRAYDPAKGSPSSWVALLVRHTASEWRSRLRLPFQESAGAAPLGPPASEEAQRLEGIARLSEALSALPAREGLCLALLMEQGLPAAEAAGILGVERQSVYAIRDRALARLREILGESQSPT